MGKPPLLTHLRRPADAGRSIYCLLLLALLVAIAPPAGAIEMASLYTAQVPLDPEESDPRTAAYRTALQDVLLRVSGSAVAADPELFDLLFPSPTSYVVQYRPGPDDTLFVSFDGEAVEDVLRRNGQPVWGSDRPLTLIWLAVDWGQGEREIIGADDPERTDDEARTIDRNRLLRERVLDVAERRGLPIAFPLLDTEDLAKVTFPDIWGGFDELVLDASQRYEANSVLIGRIRPESSQQNRWTWHFGNDLQSWNGEPELVVSLIADQLAAEFAIGGDAVLESVVLNISGVNSVDVIETFTISEVQGDRIQYRVSAHGGAERLSRALQLAGLIEQDRFGGGVPRDFPGDPMSESLEFYFEP